MEKKRVAWLAVFVVLFGASVVTYCTSKGPVLQEVRGDTMGTTYLVKVVGAEADPERIRAILDEVDASMSTYKPDSEVMRFARHGEGPFEISDGLRRVIEKSLEVSSRSGGAFDPTVAPLVAAWGFGAAAQREPPDDETLEQMRAVVGWENLSLSPDGLSKANAGVSLDLSAIAKGFAVDEVARYLETLDHSGYLVEIGGEVRVGGKPWSIGIEHPRPQGKRETYKTIEISSGSLATSGSYRNFRDDTGVRVSHTIDPRTGRPVDHKLVSASVLAQDCMTADAWATAMTVLGPAEGLELAMELQVAVLLLVEAEDGTLVELQSDAFKSAL